MRELYTGAVEEACHLMWPGFLTSVLNPFRARRERQANELYTIAMAAKDAGNIDGARSGLRRAVSLSPGHAEAQRWLGILYARDQLYAESVRHLEQALAAAPASTTILIDLANIYALQREYRKASFRYQAAIEIDPDIPLARLNLGYVLKELGDLEGAIPHLRRAYALAPEMENALRNLVTTLVDSERFDEARQIAAEALARDPDTYEPHFFLGLACHRQFDMEQALAHYNAADKLRPGQAELHRNRGLLNRELGRLPEAIDDFERYLESQPGDSSVRLDLALVLLLMGDYKRGWREYQARKSSVDYPRRMSMFPDWDGAPLENQTVLVLSEQGLGDEIMFASCLPQIVAAAGHCMIECEPRLLELFRRSFPGAMVFAATSDRSIPAEVARDVDLQAAAGDIPRYLRRDSSEFPRHEGYLKADVDRVAKWRDRLAGLGPGLKVGVSWTGGVPKTRRALRSTSLEQWLPILRTPGAHFISLQYTADAGSSIEALNCQGKAQIHHWPEAIKDYEETAALVCALDLVVSVCTAVIHLGGALGRPVWVLAPYSPEWRYGFSGDTMPWYRSIRMFRQPAFGAWDPLIASVAVELRSLARIPSC